MIMSGQLSMTSHGSLLVLLVTACVVMEVIAFLTQITVHRAVHVTGSGREENDINISVLYTPKLTTMLN